MGPSLHSGQRGLSDTLRGLTSPLWNQCCSGIALLPPPGVLGLVHEIEVVRPLAECHPAQVLDRHPRRDRPEHRRQATRCEASLGLSAGSPSRPYSRRDTSTTRIQTRHGRG